MKRSASSRSLAWGAILALAAAHPACAFDDGRPWGRLAASLDARLAVPADRLSDGAIKTDRNYLVTLEAVDVTLTGVTVSQAAAGGAATFDPANPPAGYSLCHNGHCHADDGRLVDYEDIAAELAGGVVAGGPSLSLPGPAEPVVVPVAASTLGDPVPVSLGACPGECAFERGALAAVSVVLGTVRVRGVVRDQLTGDAARLPAEGRAFDVGFTALGPVTAPLTGAFGKDEPFGLDLATTLELPAALFDGVDWSAIADDALPAALASTLSEEAALTVETSRFD